jgi:peptidoglycan/LPS O-acetylase OafA/YrhL
VRRYLRLTPLYSIVLIYFYVTEEKFNNTLQIKDFVFRILYLDSFKQSLFFSSPSDIFWTISIEFWLSLLIPLFVYVFKETKLGELFLLSCFLVSVGSPIALVYFGVDIAMANKSLPSALFCFAVGSFISLQSQSEEASKAYSLILILGIGFAAMYLWGGFMGQWWVTVILTCGYLGKMRTGSRKLTTSVSWGIWIWLGTICYGVYLLHSVFIDLLSAKSGDWLFYWALFPVLALATISWIAVEKPFNNLLRAGIARKISHKSN